MVHSFKKGSTSLGKEASAFVLEVFSEVSVFVSGAQLVRHRTIADSVEKDKVCKVMFIVAFVLLGGKIALQMEIRNWIKRSGE